MQDIRQDGKPAKKVYSITPAGRLALIQALEEPPGPDRLRSDFLFTMFFGQLLPARDIDNLISARVEMLNHRLGEMEECRRPDMPGGEAFSLGYGMAIYRAAADYLENHRHELVGAALRNEMHGPADESIPSSAQEAKT